MATFSAAVAVACTCRHPVDCDHDCHRAQAGPTVALAAAFPADVDGLTAFGCADCTPGQNVEHDLDCPSYVPPEYRWGSPELA